MHDKKGSLPTYKTKMALTPQQQKGIFLAIGLPVIGSNIYLFRSILGPFFLGAFLGYLLHPLATLLTKWGLSRKVSSFFLISLVFCLLFTFAFYFLPFLEQRFEAVLKTLPTINRKIYDLTDPFYTDPPVLKHNIRLFFSAHKTFTEMLRELSRWVTLFLLNTVNAAGSTERVISYTLVVPLVAYDCTKDWPFLVRYGQKLIPQITNHKPLEGFFKKTSTLVKSATQDTPDKHFWHKTTKLLEASIRGQALICIFMTLFYSLAFLIFKIPDALIMGILNGLLLFISYVGSALSVFATLMIVLTHEISSTFVLQLCLIFSLGQLFKKTLLIPFFLPKEKRIHPLVNLFSVFAAYIIMGPFGAFMAMPLAALSLGILRWLFHTRKESPPALS